jgi:nucleoside-diphosphate-sugar epimerase
VRALIIGCGYVGTELARELSRRGHQVHGLRRNPGAVDIAGFKNFRLLTGDISFLETLSRIPNNYDWVVNTASASGGGLADYVSVYEQGTLNLLEWLKGSSLQKYVYTSSTGVYGQTDGAVVIEESPTKPVAETAKVLVNAEGLLFNSAETNKFPAVILRVAGIYGPGRGYWLKQFLAGQARLEGDGGRVLNMIHRDDVVGAIIRALEQGRTGEAYNAVDDEPVTQRELFAWLSARLKLPMPESSPAEPTPRKRGVTDKRVSNAKLKMELGYKFIYPTFREGFDKELYDLGYPRA